MPIALNLTAALNLYCLVHIIRSGRSTVWLAVVFFAPVVGALAYIILEVLPEMRHSRAGQKAVSDITKIVDPNRDLRELTTQAARADTIANKSALAKECLDKGHFGEAKDLFESCLTGMHETDPDLMQGLALAQFELKEFAAAIDTLDRLRAANPEVTMPEGHLIFARAKEELGDSDAALEEYEALTAYYPGEEARCRYALLLQKAGRVREAKEQFQRLIARIDDASKVYFRSQRDWYQVAQRNLEG